MSIQLLEGIGKGHIVKEIDAMGGMIYQAADYASIHYKVLNSKTKDQQLEVLGVKLIDLYMKKAIKQTKY